MNILIIIISIFNFLSLLRSRAYEIQFNSPRLLSLHHFRKMFQGASMQDPDFVSATLF